MGRGRPLKWESKLNRLLEKLEAEGLTERWIYEVNRVTHNTMKIIDYKAPEEFNESDIREILSKIGGGVRNQKYHRAILSTYLEYCGNPIIRQMRFRDPQDMRPNAHWLSHGQVDKLLSIPLDPREEFVVRMGLCMGMRCIEMRRLKLDNIKRTEKGYHFDVCGKRSKWRSVPASNGTMEALKHYKVWREEVLRGKKTDYMMVGSRSLHLSYKGMDRICKIICKKSGVKWTFHDLRRTWGRTAYEADQPLLKIMFILGHSTEKQTIEYLGLRLDDGKDAIDAVERFHSRYRGGAK